ncbi:MAG TPA: hypothetical protein VK400_11390 [Pyrinomonadaceae bacterium]|nr:hypothetical protein [Pyrinomonadaceae bacterium]
MRKLKFPVTLILTICFAAGNAFGQDAAFQTFWTKFKSAVAKKDKNRAANLSGFPVSMPAFQKSVRTKADFLRRFNHIFNGEADAAKCFPNATPRKVSAKRYEVNCGFKNDPRGDGGEPIVYSFELTKSGWKFAGLDNINE